MRVQEAQTFQLQTCGLKIGRDADSATKAKPRNIPSFRRSMIFSENRIPLFRIMLE